MADPVVHFEIIGTDPGALQHFYRRVFGWEPDTASPVAPEISDAGSYGFVEPPPGAGIPGGVGGGPSHAPRAMFYIGVPDVGAALATAVDAGARVVLDPVTRPDGALVVAHFEDPEGNLIGLAGPE